MPTFAPKHKRQSSVSCQNGGFYKSPAHGDKIDMHGASTSSVNVVWDTSCLNPAPSQVDIYLVSPEIEANLGRITVWGNVPYSLGQFDVQLDSTLWNSTASIDMQVQIIQAGTPVFLSQMAAGPIFEVINASPSTGSASIAASSAARNSVTGASTSTAAASSNSLSDIWHDYAARFANRGLSGGKLAASIVMPILVAFSAIAAYVFFSRRREARKRAAWKEETDKRMSMVSTDWQSMSAAGGVAAVRGSFQTGRTPHGSIHTPRTPSMHALDAATGLVAPSPLRAGFASEDISQLGPRARALSAAAAEGRLLSSVVNEKAPPLPGAAPRTRSKSTAALGAIAPLFGARANGHGRTTSASAAMAPAMATARGAAAAAAAAVRPPMPRANTGRSGDDARPRTLSVASNNPFADAMTKRDSQGYSPAPVSARGMAFPTSAGPATPTLDSAHLRTRADSEGRPLDNASRARVASRVSFADVLNERHRTQSNLSRNRLMDNTTLAHEDYLEMQDALPALALMRTQSNGHEGVAFPSSDGGHVLGPRPQFMSAEDSPGAGSRGSGVGSYFGSAPFAELGESPDDALRRIAAQRRDSMRGSEDSGGSGIFGSLRRGLNRFRK